MAIYFSLIDKRSDAYGSLHFHSRPVRFEKLGDLTVLNQQLLGRQLPVGFGQMKAESRHSTNDPIADIAPRTSANFHST